ncbi:beta-galactosidase [bacterium]|nr:beta-galactosidase [bacterium]
MSKVLSCLVLLGLSCVSSPFAFSLSITSDSPGNIFVAGAPVGFTFNDPQGAVSYQLTDYFGKVVTSGTTTADINLSDMPAGWYELKCSDSASEVTTSIGVVLNRGKAALPEDGRICTDAAAAWLIDVGKYKDLARIMRLAGIPWARERFSWTGTEPEKGKFDWNKYQAVADAYASEGIRLYELWHDSPKWSHPASSSIFICPDDLRDVYDYARAASGHFSRQVEAWEIWNEPDIEFWSQLSDRYSGYLKAVYLGLKDGNPKAYVLQGSLLRGVSDFLRGLYDSGTTGYFDIFNWHNYHEPSTYIKTLNDHMDLLGQYCSTDRPIWLTECGIRLDGTEGPKKELLNRDDQHLQCQFIPRNAVMSLAAGTDKSFFFVLPSYLERGIQFGALHPDLTPYPSFVALSAAANILGQSTYKGEYKTGNHEIVAQVFSTRTGNVMVAWSDIKTQMSVPTDKKSILMANIFGQESHISTEKGELNVNVGPDAIYLIDIGKSIEKKLTGNPRPRGRLPKLNPSRVIVMGHSDLPVIKEEDVYKLTSRSAFDYSVEVYNFSEKKAAKGTVELVAPDGWGIENPVRHVTLEPMGRQVLIFQVKPGILSEGRFRIIAHGNFANEKVADCVSSFWFNLAAVKPVASKPLGWNNIPGQWIPLASQNCSLRIDDPKPGLLRINTKFDDDGAEQWAYPTLNFARPVDMSDFDGIAFDLNMLEDSYSSMIRLVLVEPDGTSYMGATKSLGKKHRVVLLFSDMKPFDAKVPDANGHLDLKTISKVKFGCTCGREYLAFEVSNFELVKFD